MTCGIYCYIDNTNNCIVYIGQSIHMEHRHKEHLTKSKYNSQPFNAILQNNKTRYTFKKILHCSREALNDLEKIFIKIYNPIFNYTSGGDGLGTKLSQEVREKISQSTMGLHRSPDTEFKKGQMSGSNNPMFNKKHTEKSRQKMSKTTKGMYIGKNNPKSKYTLWNNIKCHYDRRDMYKYKTEPRPRKVFKLKYNSKIIYIGGFLDFITCELLYDLINQEMI
ncbi:MAG: GIY-YIG nuclease family protein [Clostridia bacterium]|nr:GIY-YIG nuclease family protein [Clostridia bacterium]